MANIELPRDAEGREIPLDTKVLYDKSGSPCKVWRYVFLPNCTPSGIWSVVLDSALDRLTSKLYLNPPDSWEKLEEDLDRCVAENHICMYYSKDGTCRNCAIRDTSDGCFSKVLKDIVSRIRNLRGENHVR